MQPNRPHGEVFELALDEVQGFGDVPTQQEMVAAFASIGSLEDWAQRWGVLMNSTVEDCLLMATMLRMGTEERLYPEFSSHRFRALFPTATPPTYWIFIHTEGIGDAVLCARLLKMTKDAHFDANAVDAPKRANICVRLLEESLRREGVARLSAALHAEDATKGAGKGSPSSTAAAKAEGKGPGKGKRSRRPHA